MDSNDIIYDTETEFDIRRFGHTATIGIYNIIKLILIKFLFSEGLNRLMNYIMTVIYTMY